MNIPKVLLGLSVFLLIISLSLNIAAVRRLNQELGILDRAVGNLETRINRTNGTLATLFPMLETNISTIDQRVNLLEQSVDSKTKRWAQIKLVRDTIQTIKGEALPIEESTAIASAIVERADEFDVPVSFVMAVIKCESNYNKAAVSPAGAVGLMQLLPSTAEDTASYLGVKYYNLHSAKSNIHLGVAHLAKLSHLYKKDVVLATQAYNCGAQCVANVQAEKWSSLPNETIRYVEKVTSWKKTIEEQGISW